MNKKNRSLRNQQGLTLIEALAGFIIFAIIMLILYSGFVTARKVTSKGDLWQSRENVANNVIEGNEEADISVTNQKGGLITLQFGEKAVSFPGTYVLSEDPDNPAVTLMAYQEMAGFDANNVMRL